MHNLSISLDNHIKFRSTRTSNLTKCACHYCVLLHDTSVKLFSICTTLCSMQYAEELPDYTNTNRISKLSCSYNSRPTLILNPIRSNTRYFMALSDHASALTHFKVKFVVESKVHEHETGALCKAVMHTCTNELSTILINTALQIQKNPWGRFQGYCTIFER